MSKIPSKKTRQKIGKKSEELWKNPKHQEKMYVILKKVF